MAKPTPKATPNDKAQSILSSVDAFCRSRLNDEYAVLCAKVVGILARKRPSPLVNGTIAAWACGVVRAIGWVNFLDDKSTQPHMKASEIDKHFGVSTATGQAKSKLVRDPLKTRPMDPKWTLPSRMDSNPMAWFITVNGLMVDARRMPREVQEIALAKGLIPYIPDDDASPTDESHR